MSVSVYANDTVGSDSRIFVNGEEIYDASAITYEGYTMVPVRFVGEKLGCRIFWDEQTKTANAAFFPPWKSFRQKLSVPKHIL